MDSSTKRTESRPRRGGRPRKAPSKRRTCHQYTVKVNEAEHEAVESRAAKAGLKPAVYLRQAGVGAKLGVAHSQHVYHRLSRIGLKVKQLAGAAEETGRTEDKETLDALLQDVLQLRDEF